MNVIKFSNSKNSPPLSECTDVEATYFRPKMNKLSLAVYVVKICLNMLKSFWEEIRTVHNG